jgi:hypothetical protein
MRRFAVCALVLGASLTAVPAAMLLAPSALGAPDDKDDKRKDEERKKKKRQKETALKAIGDEFAAKNVDALVRRVPKDAKLKIEFGEDNSEYSRDQAKGVLNKHFDGLENISVTFTQAEGNVGAFTMTARRKRDDREVKRKLQITVDDPDANGDCALTRIYVSP